MKPVAEIFSQGEEVISGQIVDSNAAWLSQRLVEMGFAVKRHSAVGDDLADLKKLLSEIAERADCCICTGGLGPTVDDLTAEAVAQAFSMPLRFDQVAYEQIEHFFRHRERAMPETNRKQAMIPEGAERIDNEWGTAPGFAFRHRRCRFVFLPGVPSEMRNIFDQRIGAWLKQWFSLRPDKLVTIKTLGIGESDLQTLLDRLTLPDAVQLGFRASPEHVETKLLFPADFPEAQMTNLVDEIAGLIEPFVFAVDGLSATASTLVGVVDRLMTAANITASFVETASQGLMAAKCLGRGWLSGAVYEASPEALARRLNITLVGTDLYRSGRLLADALWSQSRVDIVLVQLYRGDWRRFSEKEQTIELITTLVHNIEEEQTYTMQENRILWGTPERKQNQSALLGLDLLRRHLLTKQN